MSQTIPARADVDARFTWNLADIFPTDDAWREEFAACAAQLDTLRGYQGRLAEHAQTRSIFCAWATRFRSRSTGWATMPAAVRRGHPQCRLSGDERPVYEPCGRDRRSVGLRNP